jgi:hypothetical protein
MADPEFHVRNLAGSKDVQKKAEDLLDKLAIKKRLKQVCEFPWHERGGWNVEHHES